jgi:hypothetical protein
VNLDDNSPRGWGGGEGGKVCRPCVSDGWGPKVLQAKALPGLLPVPTMSARLVPIPLLKVLSW